jgi:hypothetical protein
MPEGIYPVMLTPFTASSVNSDGDPAVDHPCLAALSEWYIRSVRASTWHRLMHHTIALLTVTSDAVVCMASQSCSA